MDTLLSLLGRQGYLPHGYCIDWSPGLLWTMVGSDLTIAGAYFSIPLAIGSFVRRRRDPSLRLVATLFCAFILACGLTHVMDVWTIWEPDYAVQALSKAVTGVISIVTAVVLWLLIPQALRVPSVGQLQAAVASLEAEVRQRRSAEESLIDTEQSLALALASIGAGFMSTNRDGQVTRMNRVAESIFGWTEAEALGRDFRDVYVREGRQLPSRGPALIERMLAEGITIAERREVVAVSRDGKRTPLEVRADLTRSASGEVRGLVTLFQDLSELRRAEAARLMAEQRFKLVVESVPNAILMVDDHRRITLANERADELFGCSRAELLGQPIDSLVPERLRDEHVLQVEAFQAHPADRAMGAGRDLVALRRDGTEVPVEIRLRPFSAPEGQFTLASIVDITQRQRVDAELRRSNAELEQFAYIASHDLQEPLRMVVSYSELLAQRYQGRLDEKADKYIHYAVDGARRMQRLVTDLLAYSRVGSQGRALEPTSTAAAVDRVLEVLAGRITESGAIVQAESLPMVLADPTQLDQLFLNLIGNALKFRSEAPPHIVVKAERDRDRWRLSVSDNGIGLEMQFADRIFQMFQRLHERGRYEGSGIGLAIVKRIVERHGGRIALDSTPGLGTTFSFSLPAVPASMAAGPGSRVA